MYVFYRLRKSREWIHRRFI